MKRMSICIAPMNETSLRRSGIARIVKGYNSFTCTLCVLPPSGMSHTCFLPSQAQLVLIYRPWRDGRLSRLLCTFILLSRDCILTVYNRVRNSATQPLVH